ncbi:T9SS type A sorting domain-containing protein, partial [Patescibacteria group bacterium]|nr:T9SS type A sorting domain-containing protein [Patescibacteria group bacterium]
GNISWQKSLGGTSHDAGCSVRTTFDGGCIIAGETSSNDGDVIGNHGNGDYWIVKLDAMGNIQWQKCFGGTSYDVAHTACLTSDGGYIVAGRSNSNDGDVLGNHGNWDYWIVKLNVIGDMEWQKCFGGSSYDRAYSIKQILDGGYIITGQSYSFDGDVTGNHGDGDCWIVKINVWGDIEWQKCFGGSDDDSGNFIEQTPDNGYLVAGKTWSNDGDVIGHVGICSSGDYWVLKLDTIGNMEWQKCLGGSDFDAASFLCLAFDGGSVIAGLTESNDIDVANNHGESDYWIVKLVSFPASMEDMNSFLNIRVHPNPFVDFINIDISDKNTDVKLVNLLGQIVAETNLQGKNFISGINVPAGAYILQLQNAGKIFSKIMIKNPQ